MWIIKQAKRSRSIKILDNPHNEISKFLTKTYDQLEKAGLDPKKLSSSHDKFSLDDMADLYDYYSYQLNQYGKFKNGFTRDLYNQIKMIFSIRFQLNYITPDINRLQTNGIAKEVLQVFKKKISKPTNKLKYFGLSGHDLNIQPLLTQFEVVDVDCLIRQYKGMPLYKNQKCEKIPEFASNLIWELSMFTNRNKENEYLVRVLYNGHVIHDCSGDKNSKYIGYCTFEQYEKMSNQKLEVEDDAEFGKICRN